MSQMLQMAQVFVSKSGSNIGCHVAQIFIDIHTGLLDLTLLRRDQIWFAEKDEKTMQTDIYALTEFSPRKGENIAKGYLQGRYGAIPHMRKELLKSV